jgi:hypothetical protein
MQNRFAIAFGVGLAIVGLAVAGILFVQRGARIGLTGKILKVRTAPLDEKSSVAVVDFRFTNPSDYRFVVRTVTVVLEDSAGTRYNGDTISEVDAKRLFEALPLLGQKYAETLLMKDTIAPHAAQDRMVAARFEAPESKLESRKRFLVRIEDVDGPITEFSER